MEEIIKVWKLPAGINIAGMRLLKGEEGSLLNPVQDINGNWIISQEEYNAEEFQYLKTSYADIVNSFELIDYEKIFDPGP